MKLLLKLLLWLCILLVGIYAATPLWLPYAVVRQLPPGWQLENLDTGYWGFSGIDINELRVNGDIQAAGIELIASDIRFTYRGLKTEIGSLSLDLDLVAMEDRSADALTLKDLSLPVTQLTGKMPELSVLKLRMVLHHEISTVVTNPLVLDFQSIKLTPGADNSFHFLTDVSLAGSPGIYGRVDVDASANVLKTDIRFPASAGSPPWFELAFKQQGQTPNTTTQIQAVFDAAAADQEWLDSELVTMTGGTLKHVSGKLEARADFAGRELQALEQVSIAMEHLQAEFDDGSLNMNAEFVAIRDDEMVTITLPDFAEIQFQDGSGQLHELIMGVVPGLQRTSPLQTTAHAVVDAKSNFVIHTGKTYSVVFSGDANLEITSEASSFGLQTTDLKIQLEDFSRLDAATVNGLVTLNWVENTPFSFISDDLGLKAEKSSLTSAGHVQFSDQTLVYEQAGDFGIQLEGMQAKLQTGTAAEPAWLELNTAHYAMQGRLGIDLSMSEPDAPVNFYFDGPLTATNPVITVPGDEHTLPMTISADEMTLTAALTSSNGELVSSGSGTFINGQILPETTSATKTDITWQELDLINLAGNLSTKTQGFATELEGESWTGFDVDITYYLLNATDVNGSGTVIFDSGLEMPIVFEGNTQTERWNVSLPASRIKLSQLDSLLRVAHVEIPESIRLTDGYIEMQGDVKVGDEINAKMMISGYEMGASMLESSASEASFAFNATYGSTISAKGPVAVESVSLAGGIDVSHVRADLNLENTETLGLNDLHAELLDGELNLAKLRFAENRIEDTTIELMHIDLNRLLTFADIDGLEGTGSLDILLPAGSDEQGVHIRNGTFSSTGPGRLVYSQEGMAASNVGMQALENFHYKELSGTVDYQSDGDYQITVRLDGKNPDLYGGHPIAFNLNINGSLPEFFEALFMTGSFEESILKQMRSNYVE